jgi:hypothetical protein
VDTKLLSDDDFAYALGARGSTRRKLAKVGFGRIVVSEKEVPNIVVNLV